MTSTVSLGTAMTIDLETTGSSPSPLEEFLRDYAEVTGGMWDEVEPQVYDLMLPGREGAGEPEMVRLVFDPEAIPEHPGAQLASYGTPLIDRLLADAVNRGRHLELYTVGLNQTPQGVEDRLRRAVTLPPGFVVKLERARPLHFPQAVFWFEATFVSDQKEQDLLTVAIDVHHGRQVRHLDRLLDRGHLAEKPWAPLADAPHPGLASAYPIARDRVVRTLSALANTSFRELHERLDRQLERIGRYYADLRAEVEEQAKKARNRDEDPAKFAARIEALEREEQLRSRRAAAEEPVEGPPATAQPAGDPSAQAAPAYRRDRVGDGFGHRPARVGLGPAHRGHRGRRLPRLPSSDVRVRRHPPGPPRLPGLRIRRARPRGPRGDRGRQRMDVYLLWHVHELPDGEEDGKLIGVYSSRELAEQARLRALGSPGFREIPEGFIVDRYTVDEDHWTEGYVTVTHEQLRQE